MIRFILPVLLAIPAVGQLANQYGTRIAPIQIAYMEEPGPREVSREVFVPGGGSTTVFGPVATGPRVEFETWVEQIPRDYAESISSGISGIERQSGKAIIHRFIRDNFRHIYVSYAATVEREAGTFRVTLGGSTAGSSQEARVAPDWKAIAPAQYPAPQILEDGETIALELYSAGSLGAKLIDYIRAGRQPQMSPRKEVARDAYADDAEFMVAQPRLRINGRALDSAALPETVHGPVLWVYVPGYGRSLLSFRPHPDVGFQKAGEVAGGLLTFTLGRNVFRVDCAERIAASGSGTYNVYLRQDPAWQPEDPQERARAVIGSAPGVP